MKTYYPSYYDKFSCIAGECPDSCCKSWEIVIDDNTYKKYCEIKNGFGEKLRSYIVRDEDGDFCFRLISGRCPFLNEDGLCDIHIELGEELTSEICRVHPRFVEEYDGFTEIALSLSCPAAAELIVTTEYDISSAYPVPEADTDDDVLLLLIKSRADLLSGQMQLFDCVRALTEKASGDEEKINSFIISSGYEPDVNAVKAYVINHLSRCEILSSAWTELLKNAATTEITDEEFKSFIFSNEKELRNILYYYIYRYYLKSVNDLDVYTRTLFIIYSVFVTALIAVTNNFSVCEAARLYSKEIEHSTKNTDIIFENLCEY